MILMNHVHLMALMVLIGLIHRRALVMRGPLMADVNLMGGMGQVCGVR
jgi:hypothetical protein